MDYEAEGLTTPGHTWLCVRTWQIHLHAPGLWFFQLSIRENGTCPTEVRVKRDDALCK